MSLSRFTGLVYTSVPVPEDHRKPNIIRGGTNSKSKRPPPKNVKSLPSTNHSTIAIAGNNGMQLDQGYAVQTAQVLNDDGSNPQIFFSDEIHQLIQPSEISPVSQGQGLVQAAIQTDSGSYIVLLKEEEIANLQSQTATPAGGQEASDTFNHSDLILTSAVECQSSENSEEAISVMSVSADEEIIAAVQNISSSEPQQHHQEDDGSFQATDECGTTVINGFDHGNGEGNDVVQVTAEGTQFMDETQQYILFQLPDGNSYFVPTSSLDSQSVVVDGACDQIVVDENGDQVIQYVSADSGAVLVEPPTSYWKQEIVTTTTATSNRTVNRTKKRESSDTAKTVNKRQQVAKSNGSYAGSIRSSPHVSRTFYSQPKPLPVSRSAVSTIAKQPPPEDLKPRPFRFDMPEEDLLSIEDSSTDYLSLVIQQFQKENCVKK